MKEFEQNIDDARSTEAADFLEEGVTLDDSALAEDGTHSDDELPMGEEEGSLEEDLFGTLEGTEGATTTGGSGVSHIEVVKEATEDIERAERQMTTDVALARVTLAHVNKTITYLESSYTDETMPEIKESVEVLKADAVTLQQRLDKVFPVDNPVVVADLAGKIEGSLKGSALFNGQHVLYTERALYTSLDPSFSTVTKVALPPDAAITSVTPFPYNNTIALGVTPGKLAEFIDGEIRFVDMDDNAWKGMRQVLNYANRRSVYALDPAANQVWKYNRGGTSYGAPTASLGGEADVADGVSLAIDGNIFVLKATGEIQRYLNGDLREDFVVRNAPSNYRSATDAGSLLLTREELEYVYVLNHGAQTIFVYKKDTFANTKALEYVKQFTLPEEIVDMDVNTEETELTLITTEKILRIPLGLSAE